MNKSNLTTNEILDAIKRSGYLLESEMTKYLANKGYFVESNHTILDPITKKSREIDLVAEYFEYDEKQAKNKTVAKVHFVFEIKNNTFPIVLLTQLEFSPNTDTSEGFKEVISIPDGLKNQSYEGFWEELLMNEKFVYTQYCSFQMKKGKKEELMAIHPENLHSGIAKIVQYCDEVTARWNKIFNSDKDNNYEYFRHFLYLPIILISDNLYELDIDSTNITNLRKVEISKLYYNYYYHDELRSSLIFIMTKNG